MAVTFTPDSKDRPVHLVGDVYMLKGSLTFTGSYATGGDALDLTNLLSQIGKNQNPQIQCLSDVRGNAPEYDNVNKKLKLFGAANTEVAAAAYNAALTASPVPAIFVASLP